MKNKPTDNNDESEDRILVLENQDMMNQIIMINLRQWLADVQFQLAEQVALNEVQRKTIEDLRNEPNVSI